MTGADNQLIIDALEDLSDLRMPEEAAWQRVGAVLNELRDAVEDGDGEAGMRACFALVDLGSRRGKAQPGPIGLPADLREQRNHLIHELTADLTPPSPEHTAPADAADDRLTDSR